MKRPRVHRTIALAVFALLFGSAVLLAAPLPQAALAHPSTFPDVAETDPAHEAIESLVAIGVISGFESGDFRPSDPVTRAQATKMLVSWHGSPLGEYGSSFSDVDGLYSPYVETAATLGWVTGYPDGTFRPQASLTRQQTATVVIRSLGLEATAASLTSGEIQEALAGFPDRGVVSSAARPYVALALTHGLFTGDGYRLDPATPISRAQLSLVLHRATGLLVADEVTGGMTQDPDDGTAQTPAQDPAEGDSFTPEEQAMAAFMDTYLFGPHSSPVTGAMVLQNARWYGIPPLPQLVIMAAETSLGDPELGGAVARSNNFGCLRYHGEDTPWGQLSDGRIWVAGRDWYSFPSPAIGMAAFGRYLKSAMDGLYVPLLAVQAPLWEEFAAVYYGRGVSGFGSYVDRLRTIEQRLREMAAERGVSF